MPVLAVTRQAVTGFRRLGLMIMALLVAAPTPAQTPERQYAFIPDIQFCTG
jgi:hypothetical protein